MSFHGFKEDVSNAKSEVALILADKVDSKNNEYEDQLYICKNVQWLYEEDMEWMSFPLYLNTIIETAHSKKSDNV